MTKDPAAYILGGYLERGWQGPLLRLRNSLRKAATDARAVTRRRPVKDTLALSQFLDRVLTAVAEAGGHLTLDKNYRRGISVRRKPSGKDDIKPGNLLPFLDRLRRYLAQDFLPSDHPISLYSRVKKDWSRRRANRTKIPA